MSTSAVLAKAPEMPYPALYQNHLNWMPIATAFTVRIPCLRPLTATLSHHRHAGQQLNSLAYHLPVGLGEEAFVSKTGLT